VVKTSKALDGSQFSDTPGGHVFGGVREVGYGGSQQWLTTDKAFVYGIRTHGSPDAPVVFLPTKNTHWGIEQRPNAVAQWGGGSALKIGNNANLPSKQAGVDCQTICPGFSDSHSNIGATYTGNGITSHDTEASHNYLAGSWYFSLTEIEVFRLVVPAYSADLTTGLSADKVTASGGSDESWAIDDNASSEWSEGSAATAVGAWFAVEFGSAVEIRKVTIKTGSGNNACVDIDVEYYDGSAWVVAQNIRPGADDAVHAFAVAASSQSTKWRLVSKISPAAPYSWTIRELEMMTFEPPFTPGPGVTIQHIGTASNPSNSGANGGTVAYNTMTLDLNRGRKVVVALSGRQRTATPPTLSGTAVTATVVGGSGVLQFSRLIESPGSSGSMFTEIWAIDLDDAVDTGSGGAASATIEVSINYGGNDAYGSLISMWQVYGAAEGSDAVFGSINVEAGTAADANGVITVPALGGLVCFADTTGPERSFVWSGVKEDFDERFTGQHHSAASGASAAFPTGAEDHQITCDQGATTVRMVCAAFESAA
jgi:hypothetical protein